jgi:hypothetical protein
VFASPWLWSAVGLAVVGAGVIVAAQFIEAPEVRGNVDSVIVR